MNYKLEAACGCNTGYVRSNNEDNFYFDKRILPPDNKALKHAVSVVYKESGRNEIFSVFDGMGGEEDGQIASFLAASKLKELYATLEDYIIPPKEFLTDVVLKMNDTVWKEAEVNFSHMGTTAVIHWRCWSVFCF